MYAKKWLKSLGRVKCMNSWGNNEEEPELLPVAIKNIYLVKLQLEGHDYGSSVIKTKGRLPSLTPKKL